ncbi:zeta toxin family protein [Mucilaginibacter galii]|uniref:ATPase AAA n=1 Tax=Mucilaginibacter galii TaxID=2005073 RepID=A0A917J827_9SPHI|nr:zeta toxin family protein [Mucilaginibacter galii]GGI49605.1 ATPase AAA [Mucilaginibacter galii]
MQSDGPLLVVIAGPNGSGKTTLTSYLIEKKRIKMAIINPDEIAFKEFGSYQHQVKAARLALDRRKTALLNSNDVAFESTFSGNSEINDIKQAIKLGYKVILYYVALQSVLDNVIRVKERQFKLGHNVENGDIIRRFHSSQTNLINYISLFDTAYLFDNSEAVRSRVAIFSHGKASWVNPKHIRHPFYQKLFNQI